MAKEKSTGKMLGPFALVLAAIVLVIDVLFARAVFNQLSTLRFPATRGRVTASRIAEEPGDESVLYRPVVEYAYEVGGRAYTGQQIGNWESATSNRKLAQGVIERYVVGQPVTVYYSPRDASRAILDRRFDPNNFSFALVLLTIHVIACSVVDAAYGAAWRLRRNKPPPQMWIKRRGEETIVRLFAVTPRAAASVSAAVISFLTGAISIFVGIYDWQEKSLAIGVAVAVFAGWRVWSTAVRNAVVLRIGSNQTLQIERVDQPTMSLDLARREVRRIDVKEMTDEESESEPRQVHVVRLTAAVHDGAVETIPLVGLSAREEAQWIADWLAARLLIARR